LARKSVLITGAAGRIGRVLREGLKDRYRLRLHDRAALIPSPGEFAFAGDVTQLDHMVEVADGSETVVHLAGNPDLDAPWDAVLEANIRGTYVVLEAARRSGVQRVVFASSNHVTGYYEIEGTCTGPAAACRPDSLYGVSKAFGEDLGRYFVDRFGLSVICLRIGSFQSESSVRSRRADRILSTWLSHRDAVQLIRRSIEAKSVRFGIYYGISNNTRAFWDIRNARDELGYDPTDNAEDYA
jgi:uronate dehydrogenase